MRKVLVLGTALAVTTTVVATPGTAATPARTATRTPTGTPTVVTARLPVTRAPAVAPGSLQRHTYAYGTDTSQTLDAYWGPIGSGRRPGVLLLHGGYWLSGDKGSWKTFARTLSARGYAVFAANYRLSGQKRWPAQRDDSMAALAYVKRHAARYHLDPDRVVVIGASAGGQLATMLGSYGAGGRRVRGVVALSPVNSPYLAYLDGAKAGAGASSRKLRGAVVRLIGCTPQPRSAVCWKRLQDVTPVSFVDAADAPMLLMHSAGDFVPYEQSIALRDALGLVKISVALTKVRGSAHGVRLLDDPQVEKSVLDWVSTVTAAPTSRTRSSRTGSPTRSAR